MKNKMLALVALCGATSSTMPLWAAEWADPVLEFAAPDLKTDGTGGGVYYVYHVATQKFMCNGNYKDNWNTELVVADEGREVTLSYGDDYELSRRPETDPEYSVEKGRVDKLPEGLSSDTVVHGRDTLRAGRIERAVLRAFGRGILAERIRGIAKETG